MSNSDLSKDILKEMLNIFSVISGNMDKKLDFYLYYQKIDYIMKKFPQINFLKEINISFETDSLYRYFIYKIWNFITPNNQVYFNSSYSVLYFNRIINYLKQLEKESINELVEDEIIKIFFYLLIIFIEQNLENSVEKVQISSKKKLELDETFFKGTFIELTEKYNSKTPYKESKEIISYINHYKMLMNQQIIQMIRKTFQYIINILRENGKKTDNIIKSMIEESSAILGINDKLMKELPVNIINKIKDFYSRKEYLIFTNYISEVEDIHLKRNIDGNFLKENETKYSPFEFKYNDNNDIISAEIHQDNLENYKEQRNKYYQRMKYSCFHEIFNYDLNNEINIFALFNYAATDKFINIEKFKKKLENLDQKRIIQLIKEILNDNDFYEHYFSILNSEIIKSFFTSDLITGKNNEEFLITQEKSGESENFSKIYLEFIQKYDKRNDNYKELKNLILFKILPSGDRAYTLRHLKKIVINPAQFLLGKEIKDESNIKKILKGYLMVILLHETEHFFRVLDKSSNVNPYTPREREGGRMFIKYIFGVLSINHINLQQTNSIFCNDTWKDHKLLKNIFSEQLEDIEEEENIDEFLQNYFKNSISFFSNRTMKGKKQGNFNLNFHLRK